VYESNTGANITHTVIKRCVIEPSQSNHPLVIL
jgi:hypothetical protein